MATPYKGIKDEEAVDLIIYNIFQVQEQSRKEVINYLNDGYCNKELTDEIFLIVISSLSCLLKAIGPARYSDFSAIALRFIEIHERVEALKNLPNRYR